LSPELIKVKCVCGEEMNIHAPVVVQTFQAGMLQCSIIPDWSLDERRCRNCRKVLVPQFQKIELGWASAEMPEEKRIIVPSPQLPRDLKVASR
jgi:hypothetical protein